MLDLVLELELEMVLALESNLGFDLLELWYHFCCSYLSKLHSFYFVGSAVC